MKRWIVVVAILLSLFLFDRSPARAADVHFSINFGDALTPYGSWATVPSYGRVWYPRVSGYMPYTNGHWSYTSYGPTWVGDDAWSWAADHYGHWVYTSQFGWVWVPGYEYHPGRVAWSYGSDYIGWAPYWSGLNYSNPNFWVVIDRDNFGYRNYSGYRLRHDRVRDLFNQRVVRVHSGKFQRADLERVIRRPVRVVRVQERVIDADRHRTRIVIPDDDDRILKHVTVAHNKRADAEKRVEITKKTEKVTPAKRVEVTKKTEIRKEPTPKNVTVSKKTEIKKESTPKKVTVAKKTEVRNEPQKKVVFHSKKEVRVDKSKPNTGSSFKLKQSSKSKATAPKVRSNKDSSRGHATIKAKPQHKASSKPKQGNRKHPH